MFGLVIGRGLGIPTAEIACACDSPCGFELRTSSDEEEVGCLAMPERMT